MHESSRLGFRAGEWIIDPVQNTLTRADERHTLKPRTMDVLVYLMERPHSVVPHAELLDAFWLGQFTDDNAVQKSVSEIRKILRDDPKKPNFIKTYPRRGYSFVHPLMTSPISERVDKNTTSLSIAVLAFKDMSPDQESTYLGDGLAEQLTAILADVSGLSVISRTTAFNFSDSTLSLEEIGAKLNVRYVVEGSLIRVGEVLRITVQLIDAKVDRHVWAHTYQKRFENLFTFLDEITMEILSALKIRLFTDHREIRRANTGTDSVEALNLYMLAQQGLRNETPLSLSEVISYADAAVEIDPGFVQAYLLKAQAYPRLGIFESDENRDELYDLAFAALKDGEQADLSGEHDWAEIYAESKANGPAALQLDESETHIRRWMLSKKGDSNAGYFEYGLSLARAGLFKTALGYMHQRSVTFGDAEHALTFAATGDLPRALKLVNTSLERRPFDPVTTVVKIHLLFKSGCKDEGLNALATFVETFDITKATPGGYSQLVRSAWMGESVEPEMVAFVVSLPRFSMLYALHLLSAGLLEEGFSTLENQLKRNVELDEFLMMPLLIHAVWSDEFLAKMVVNDRFCCFMDSIGYTRIWRLEHHRRASTISGVTGIPVKD